MEIPQSRVTKLNIMLCLWVLIVYSFSVASVTSSSLVAKGHEAQRGTQARRGLP